MTNKPPVPSPMEMLARVNEALAESGLQSHKAPRDPLPLFRELLLDWYACQDLPAGQLSDEQAVALLLQSQSAVELQAAVRGVFEEAIQLSSAHGTLSVWTRRELDQDVRRLQNLIEQEQLRREASIGY